MKVAIDVSPLTSGHKVRGVGFYLKHLLAALKKYHPEHEYIEFTTHIPKDVDLVHYPYFDPFSLSLPIFKRKKTVFTVHDLTPLILHDMFPVGPRGKIAWILQQRALRKVTRVLTDSYASRDDISQLINIPSSRIDVAHLAAGEQFRIITDKKQLASVAGTYQLPPHFILYVGDGTPNKNVARLAKAALRTNTPLVIAGKVFTEDIAVHPWTKDIREVQDLAKANPKKIYVLGFVSDEDLVALYNLADVFFMPSLYEGFGLPVVEAFACGCPVVASDKGSLKEVVGDTGYVVDPYNVEAMTKALEKVIGDKKFAKALTAKGLQQSKNFSWQKTADATVLSYEKAIQSS